MGRLSALKAAILGDKAIEQTIQQAYNEGQNNPSITPIGPMESAQSMALMRQADNPSFELGQLALDPNEDIEQFKSFLRGYVIQQAEDEKGNPTLKKIVTGAPLMNEKGVEAIAGSMRVYGGKNFVLTNYTSGNSSQGGKIDQAIKDIRKRVLWAGIKMSVALGINRIEWGRDSSARLVIINMYTDVLEATLLRSLDDGERRKYYNTQKQITHTNQQQMINDAPRNKFLAGFTG
jgi:hypothetical protein